MPDVLFVGAGTCGTMAGLLAAKKLSGSTVRIVGIRCVDKIICNRFRIAKLANQILKHLNVMAPIHFSDVDLRDRGIVNYGVPSQDSLLLTETVSQIEGLMLDTTYTTKVVSYMAELIKQNEFIGATVLYWHTFSPAAMRVSLDPKALALGENTMIPLLDFKGPPIC
jgi:1-aminocyclopropane-1-carboxylate deaminase/D-cysteine desulfhydrase-like pyridoxal-dependent ACC family enzyme